MTQNEGTTSGWEIERKYLVAAVPADLDRYAHASIRQGYLGVTKDGTEIRIRHKDAHYYQTIKKGAGLRRAEVEVALTREQFDALWPLTDGWRVEKVRYLIPYAGYMIELDVYQGALTGLITGEVEFATVEAAAAFQPPPWLGREITGEARYKNRNLAVYGV